MLLQMQHMIEMMQMQQSGSEKTEDPHERAWIALQTFSPLARTRIEKAFKSNGFGPLEWYDVLWALEREGPLRQRDLAAHLLLERYSLSRLVDRLEAESLVVRSDTEADLRGQVVHLTDAGREMRKSMWAIYGPAIQSTMGGLDTSEAALLAKLLGKLA